MDSDPAHHERVGGLGGAGEILCFSERARRSGASLLGRNGNEPVPTATEDSDPGPEAELEGCEVAVQDGEPEGREARLCFDR